MRFQEKLHQYPKEEIWEEYCNFLTLSPEEIAYLEEPYIPHKLSGVMATNK